MKQVVEDLEGAKPLYGDIGATLAGKRPKGLTMTGVRSVLGQGPETFQRS